MSDFEITFISDDRKEETQEIKAKNKDEAKQIFESDYSFRAILSIEYKLW